MFTFSEGLSILVIAGVMVFVTGFIACFYEDKIKSKSANVFANVTTFAVLMFASLSVLYSLYGKSEEITGLYGIELGKEPSEFKELVLHSTREKPESLKNEMGIYHDFYYFERGETNSHPEFRGYVEVHPETNKITSIRVVMAFDSYGSRAKSSKLIKSTVKEKLIKSNFTFDSDYYDGANDLSIYERRGLELVIEATDIEADKDAYRFMVEFEAKNVKKLTKDLL